MGSLIRAKTTRETNSKRPTKIFKNITLSLDLLKHLKIEAINMKHQAAIDIKSTNNQYGN